MLVITFLIGGFGQPAAAATTSANNVVVEARAEDDGVHVHMEGIVDAPVEIAAVVVGDVERYPCWLPVIGRVRATQAFALAPVFDTEWRLPWPLGTILQRMHFERMPADSGVSFFFEQRNGEMKRHSGYWVLTELPKLLAKLEGEARRRGKVASISTTSSACIGRT
jgi:hypothetical protein